MTYADPKYVKDHQIKILLNDEHHEFVCAAAERMGKQKATVVREFMLLALRAWADGVDLSNYSDKEAV